MYSIVTVGEGDLKPRCLHWMTPIELQVSWQCVHSMMIVL